MVERLDTKISKGVLASGTKASGGQMGGGGMAAYAILIAMSVWERAKGQRAAADATGQ